MKIRVLLVDDNAQYREAVKLGLDTSANISVVGEIASVDVFSQLLALVAQTQPEVVCMDVNLAGVGGVELTRQLCSACPGIKVIGLSAHTSLQRVAEICGAGACGYVIKGGTLAELREAIRLVSQNHVYFSPGLAIGDLAGLALHLKR